MAIVQGLTGNAIYLLAGMSVEISSPEGLSYGGKTGSIEHDGTKKTLTRGFLVEDDTVGVLSIDGIPDSEGAKVKYIHNKSQNNTIYFYSAVGSPPDRAVINVVAVPIHDHSSIVQGGPAYGTYFSDDMVVRTE
jgi:hypothetical protein